MGNRSALSDRDRAAATDAAVRDLLAAGDTRGALHAARHELERAAASRRRADPARAALIDAALAGSLAEMAAALPGHQPRRPPGYRGGPPAAGHLIAAYETARAETGRG